MLSAALRSDIVETCIRIMDAFMETRSLANNAALFERIEQVELRQLEYQKKTDKKLDQVFAYIDSAPETIQKVFFDGQLFDAFSLLVELIQKAQYKIVLIDDYVGVSTLNILAKKATGGDCDHPYVAHTRSFHYRFLIIDDSTGYHIGASLKDAGRKCFAITKIQDAKMMENILNRLKKA